jgi:hypothetical protein
VKLDGHTIFALVLLIAPLAALAFWHAYEWGSGFGSKSGLWRASTVVALLLLVTLVALTIYYGADEVRAFTGRRRSSGTLLFYLWPGVALATVIFPGPASEVAGQYKELAADRGTRMFSAVGWTLFAGWAFLALLGLFARYRS